MRPPRRLQTPGSRRDPSPGAVRIPQGQSGSPMEHRDAPGSLTVRAGPQPGPSPGAIGTPWRRFPLPASLSRECLLLANSPPPSCPPLALPLPRRRSSPRAPPALAPLPAAGASSPPNSPPGAIRADSSTRPPVAFRPAEDPPRMARPPLPAPSRPAGHPPLSRRAIPGNGSPAKPHDADLPESPPGPVNGLRPPDKESSALPFPFPLMSASPSLPLWDRPPLASVQTAPPPGVRPDGRPRWPTALRAVLQLIVIYFTRLGRNK
jgi:hypothetical protein